jgi:steroid 5-alpha reductase family enzyme
VNVVGTALLLIVTLLAVPLLSYFFGTPLGPLEWSALRALAAIALAAWALCFLLGELTGNVSQVDRLWSLLPVVYAWVMAAYGDFHPRLLLMAVLVTAWGARLTFNFARQGGYRLKFWRGHEDYRWDVLRRRPEFRARWEWTLFNGLFISGYQNLLILLFTLPTVVALQFRETPLGWLDAAAAAAMLLLIGMEAVADNQQWRFQSAKKARARSGGALPAAPAKGFIDTGLWARCRHPNYFAEQGLWIAFYFFSVAASGQWINWSAAGALLLVVLFRGSSTFSEEISAGKYPAYADYRRSVPRFLPLGRRRNPRS